MKGKSVTYTLEIHHDPKYGYEAEVKELPGCFAAGQTMEELYASLTEAIGLYLSDDKRKVVVSRADDDGEVYKEQREFELCYAS